MPRIRMFIPGIPTAQLLAARDDDMPSVPGFATAGVGAAIGVGFAIVVGVLIFVMVRRLRMRDAQPKVIPGKYMKSLWWKWTPGAGGRNRPIPTVNLSTPANENTGSNLPQRGQSIRSIITLPSYSLLPKDQEQVIAVEGEREGMDMVVEFPETIEEEETRREEEMESLYQIRLRRREELSEREERRRQRREARAAGDTARLQQLSRDSMVSREANQGRPTASAMLAEHQSRRRQQRIATVTYAEIGEVRHDGSRIRANSVDSDQHPLLDNTRHSSQSIMTMRSQARSSASGPISHGASDQYGDEDTQSNEAIDGQLGASRTLPPVYDYNDWGEAPAYDTRTMDTGAQAEPLLSQTLMELPADTSSPVDSITTGATIVAAPSSTRSASASAENSSHPVPVTEATPLTASQEDEP